MGACIRNDCRIRLLGLGNELLADDAFGFLVAREAGRALGGRIEVVCCAASGFQLLDHVLGAPRLVVVDTIISGAAKPGTIHILGADQFPAAVDRSPHALGLFEVLALARELGLPVPREVTILAVEAADCTTVGGAMHADVAAAVGAAVEQIGRLSGEVDDG